MKPVSMKLTDLRKPEKNVRLHTKKQLQEFRRSVEMFGQIRPIVIDENNVILAGNGLFETLQMMGKETADCYIVTGLTDNQKKKLMLADNKVFSLGVENLDVVTSFIEEMSDDLDIPGYDEDILRQMVSDAEEVTEKVSEYGIIQKDEIEQIKSHNSEDLAPDPVQSLKPVIPESDSKEPESPAYTQDTTTSGSYTETDPSPEPTEVRKFVICPKCGEKIWL